VSNWTANLLRYERALTFGEKKSTRRLWRKIQLGKQGAAYLIFRLIEHENTISNRDLEFFISPR